MRHRQNKCRRRVLLAQSDILGDWNKKYMQLKLNSACKSGKWHENKSNLKKPKIVWNKSNLRKHNIAENKMI